MNWQSYHKKRCSDFLAERRVAPIRCFSDDEKISLAEAGATCYHPTKDNEWGTREWLEGIHSVFHHGCCTGCKAIEKCKELSSHKG